MLLSLHSHSYYYTKRNILSCKNVGCSGKLNSLECVKCKYCTWSSIMKTMCLYNHGKASKPMAYIYVHTCIRTSRLGNKVVENNIIIFLTAIQFDHMTLVLNIKFCIQSDHKQQGKNIPLLWAIILCLNTPCVVY